MDNNRCRATEETDAHYNEMDRRDSEYEANLPDFIDAARESLDAIDDYAARMMDGETFSRYNNQGRLKFYSLYSSEYTEDKKFHIAMADLAKCESDIEFISVDKRIQSLMYMACRREAAFYMRVKLDELEKLISEEK